MRKIAHIILLIMATLLVACGGDTGFVGSATPKNNDDPDAVPVSSLTLLSSSPQLLSGDASGVTITAIARDSGNLVLADKTVTFSANSGALQVINATTNADGVATATLTTGGDESNRTITVSALSGEVSTNMTVNVTGTTISVAGQSSMVLTASNTLTFTLKDSTATGIFNEDLTVTATQSPVLTEVGNASNTSSNGSLTVTTDDTGVAQITLAPTASGSHTVSVSALGATKDYIITVTNDVFELTLPNSATNEINLGASETVRIQYANNTGPVVGASVSMAATRGLLDDGVNAPDRYIVLTTNASGIAEATILSQNAGPVTIQAFVVSGPSTSMNAEFVATTANSIEVQSNISTVSLGGGKATITATVRDANNNLVKNKVINFSVEDITGGSLSSPTDITDSSGQASTVYESAQTASATNGVTVTAKVADTPAVTSSVSLTVGNRALFVTLGTGNTMIEPDETNYQKPYTVRVADASGAGVANQDVSLSIWPLKYYKGYYVWDSVAEIWYVEYTVDVSSQCTNEDVNRNGQLDVALGDIDANTDGILWPTTVATVSQGVVTTNEAGEANFTVNYSQEYASFVQVQLTATASVGGTEAVNTATFVLPVIASDVNNLGVAPPGKEINTMWPALDAAGVPILGGDSLPVSFQSVTFIGSPYGIGNPWSTPPANNCNFNEFEKKDFVFTPSSSP